MPSFLESLLGREPRPEANQGQDPLENTINALDTLFSAEGLEFLKGHKLTQENHEFLARLEAHTKDSPNDEPIAKEEARRALEYLSKKEICDKLIEQLPSDAIHPNTTLYLGQYLEHARSPAMSQRSEKSASEEVLDVAGVGTNPIDLVKGDTADNGAENDDNDSTSRSGAANLGKRQSPDPFERPAKKQWISAAMWGTCLDLKECVLDPKIQEIVGRGDGAFDSLFTANDIAVSNCTKGLSPCALLVSQLQVIKDQAESETRGTGPEARPERVRWLFLILTVADMAKKMFPNLQSSTTLARRRRSLQDCVTSRLTEAEKDGLGDYGTVFSKTIPWVFTIEQLCERFNEGILLFLARFLSRTFIDQRMTFRISNSEVGAPSAFVQLQRHFTALKVVDTLEENGATRVGRKIRERLAQEHKIEQHGSSEDHQANSGPGSGIQGVEKTGSGEASGAN